MDFCHATHLNNPKRSAEGILNKVSSVKSQVKFIMETKEVVASFFYGATAAVGPVALRSAHFQENFC